MKKSSILLIILAVIVVVALVIVLTRPSYAFIIKNNGQEVSVLNVSKVVQNNVCSGYNATCDLVSNKTEDNYEKVMVYQDFPIIPSSLNKSFLDLTCDKLNSTAWHCKNNYIIQEVRK